MKILVASKNENGGWQKVAIINCGSTSGSYNIPAVCQGQLSGMAAKAAINYFRGESSAVDVFLTYGRHDFRVHRVS